MGRLEYGNGGGRNIPVINNQEKINIEINATSHDVGYEDVLGVNGLTEDMEGSVVEINRLPIPRLNPLEGSVGYLELYNSSFEDDIYKCFNSVFQKHFGKEDIPNINFDELMNDTSRLIVDIVSFVNIIYESSKNRLKSPITVVFLDKSARNAGFMLRRMLVELNKRQMLPEGFPEINYRYLNLGRSEKHKVETKDEIIKLIREGFNLPEEGGKIGGIVIADEFVATGKTLERACELFKKITYGKINILGYSIFRRLPPWYNFKVYELNMNYGIKGVGYDIKGVGDVEEEKLKNLEVYNKYLAGFISRPMEPSSKAPLTRRVFLAYRDYLAKCIEMYVELLNENKNKNNKKY